MSALQMVQKLSVERRALNTLNQCYIGDVAKVAK